MVYEIKVKKKVLKNLLRLPDGMRKQFDLLVSVLRDSGPTGPHSWVNYGKLKESEYHCHLNRSYVACWRHEKKTITIEVYYAG